MNANQRYAQTLILLCSLLCLLSACASPTPTPTPVPTPTPLPFSTPAPTPTPQPPAHLDAIDCRFPLPAGEAVDCWDLFVPETRQDRDSPQIRLHVARIRSHSDNPQPDPVIYLEGGPGVSAFDGLPFAMGALQAILSDRDLYVYDQRGVGYSEPELDCPAWQMERTDLLKTELAWSDYRAREQQAMVTCAAQLRAAGRDLSAYNSLENTADLEALRIALGIDRWTLFGISYGTRLALTAMRDVPDGIRSVVLDSAMPMQVAPLAALGVNFQRSLDLVFQRCAEDTLCQASFPDLEETFYATISRLNEDPLIVRFSDPLGSGVIEATIDGNRLIELTHSTLYETNLIPYLPRILTDFSRGQVFSGAQLLIAEQASIPVYISEGLNYSVLCSDEMGDNSDESAIRDGQTLPIPLRSHAETNFDALSAICAAWDVDPAPPVQHQPVVSAIPTLILAGDYDPVTPPTWGYLAAETLENAYVVEFAGVSHGVFVARKCAQEITVAFLKVPSAEPDLACVNKSRPFFLKN